MPPDVPSLDSCFEIGDGCGVGALQQGRSQCRTTAPIVEAGVFAVQEERHNEGVGHVAERCGGIAERGSQVGGTWEEGIHVGVDDVVGPRSALLSVDNFVRSRAALQ